MSSEPLNKKIDLVEIEKILCKESGFKFNRVPDLTSSLLIPKFTVYPILEERILAVFFGASGDYKSFVAPDIGMCVACGLDWHGHRVKQGAVFYILGEGFAGFLRRVRAFEIKHSVSLKDYPFFYSERAAQFLDTESLNSVIESINSMSSEHGASPSIVFIDTLARNYGPGDENSTRDMSDFVAAMDHIRFEHNCSVIVIHHTGLAEKERGRGSSALYAGLDAEYRIKKIENLKLEFASTKMKDSPRPDPIYFNLQTVELGLKDEEGQEVTSLTLALDTNPIPQKQSNRLGNNQSAMLEILKQMYDERESNLINRGDLPSDAKVEVKVWQLKGVDKSIFKKDDRKAFSRIRNSLMNKGLIKIDGTFVYIIN